MSIKSIRAIDHRFKLRNSLGRSCYSPDELNTTQLLSGLSHLYM